MDVYEFLKEPDPEVYRRLQYITLDCETTNRNYGDSTDSTNRVVLTSYSVGSGTVHSVWGGVGKLDELIQLCESDVFLVGHNIKFDLGWLARCGLDVSKVLVWDTMIAEHVIYGNRQGDKPINLDATAKRYGYPGKEPYVDLCMKGGVCPSDLPESLLQRRCEYDVGVTRGVFKKQLKLICEQDKLKTMLTRCLLTPVLADIESKGMCLDGDKVSKEYNRAIKEQAEIKNKLSTIADINWNSPLQVGEVIYDKLGFAELSGRDGSPIRSSTGRRKADVGTIRSLKARNKIQREVQGLLDKRSIVEAQLSKTLNKFKECIDNDELLHAQFNQAITQTHRLSSNGKKYGVQFQNMPRIFKPCIKARNKGWLMGEADGAQLEFRVAAFLGQDAQAINDIVGGVDVHQYTADTITAAGQETDRQTAKAHTFKPLFGGRSGTKAEKAYYEAFKTKYAGVARTQERWKDQAIRDKKFRIPSGLEFFFPRIRASRSKDGYIPEESNIYNYPIQSFATADIIPVSIIYMWHEMHRQNLESFIVNTVHDSIIMEIKEEEIEKINQIALHSFGKSCYNYLNTVYNVQFNVPLGCGVKIGPNWGVGEEVGYDLPTPYEFKEA